MTIIALTPHPRYVFRIPLRFWRWIIVAVTLAPLAACSGAGAPTPTATPTPTPTQVSALAPTASPHPGRLLLNEPESFEGYTLYAPRFGNYAYLINHQGHLAYTWQSGNRLARLLDNGNVLSNGNMESAPEGNVVWEYRYLQHHDILKLPNGNVLFLSKRFISREEAIGLGANPDLLPCSPLRGEHVVEARPTGPTSAEIVWEWSVFDHLIQDFDPEKPNYGVVADHPERVDINFRLAEFCFYDGFRWMHANALDHHAELDQIMITVRHFGEIWIIDHSATMEEAAGRTGGNAGRGGDLLYRWGNPRAYRAGTPADQRLYLPHAAHWIPKGSPGAGNVLIFNNGGSDTFNNRGSDTPGVNRGYSSVDEFVLPHDGYNYRLDAGSAYGPTELAWTYAADPPESFYAYKESNAQRLPNGNTLIADAPAARIFEVTRDGRTVWEFAHAMRRPGDTVYRAYRYPPDHPGLRGLDLTPARATYRAAVEYEPLARSTFDLYVDDGALIYVKEQCAESDVADRFFLHIFPERTEDLPETRRGHGFDNTDFDFFLRGSLFDGKCAASVPLPDYAAASIRTGQFIRGEGELWSAQFWLNPEPHRTAYHAAVQSEPLARSTFDLYAADGALIYVKEQCDQSDIAPFFLHVVPEQADDLPESRRLYGFDNLDFDFFTAGALFDGKCAATIPLPDYAIVSIRTGQHVSGEGELWSAEFSIIDAR